MELGEIVIVLPTVLIKLLGKAAAMEVDSWLIKELMVIG